MILITGASGFVGSALLRRLRSEGLAVRACSRRSMSEMELAGADPVRLPDAFAEADWSTALHGVDAIVHTAARVHVMSRQSSADRALYDAVNVQGTLNLARQAAQAGVRRLVFLSSIKVNGERTAGDDRFRATDAPAPSDAYGISKSRAEDGLRDIAAQSGLEVVIVRPPLVYGPGVKANFRALMKAVKSGVPLPLASVRNRRSLVGLDNLVDLLCQCLRHPDAANQTFLVSDDHDLSTPDLLQRLAAALETPARLFAAPTGALILAAALIGRREQACRLLESLRVDVQPTRDRLGWTPPIGVDEGLRRTARTFLHETRV